MLEFNQHFPSKIASCVSNYTIITWSISMGWLARKSQCLLQRFLKYLYSETGATNNPTKVGIEWILVLVGNHWSVNGYMAPVQWFRILSHWLIDTSSQGIGYDKWHTKQAAWFFPTGCCDRASSPRERGLWPIDLLLTREWVQLVGNLRKLLLIGVDKDEWKASLISPELNAHES